MKYFRYIIIINILLLFACKEKRQEANSQNAVVCVAAMKDVMWKGELGGKVLLDTLNKKGLYGLGPVEYLKGELLIVDGKAYTSRVLSDSTMKVEETFQVKAPFFVYGNVLDWSRETLPKSIKTLKDMEAYINSKAQEVTMPFVFKLKGTIEHADIHIQNLPSGTKVSSPKEAHVGQTNYMLTNEMVDVIGFYSRDHKGVFTHHDTNMHLHLITEDRQKMGHLDSVVFKDRMQLYLPK